MIEQEALLRVNAPQPFLRGFFSSVRDILRYRELLGNLVRKELKVKYKDSVLGFLWTLARPMFLLAIYYVVFGRFLRSGIPDFAFFLFSGLVAWDLFASSINAATSSIVGNAGLIKKVYFPREILPLAAIGAGLFHFLLQLVMLFAVLLIAGYGFVGQGLLLLPLALITLVVFLVAVSLLLASANVFLRDVQYITEIVLLFWFWITPIVYSVNQARQALSSRVVAGIDLATVYMLNPITNVVIAFQRAIYGKVTVGAPGSEVDILLDAPVGQYALRLVWVLAFSLLLLWFAQRVFAKASGSFAQEI